MRLLRRRRPTDAEPPPETPAPPAVPAPSAPAVSELDPIAALTHAKDELDAGVITQAEFELAKQRIVGS